MTQIQSLLVLIALLLVKHFFADGPLQTNNQVANKGKWLHPAGLAHAGVHAGLSGLCLLIWSALAPGDLVAELSMLVLALLLLSEFVIHYLIDYSKCALERRANWSHTEIGPDGERRLVIVNERFFFSFLLDQLGHALTYVAMVVVLASTLS